MANIISHSHFVHVAFVSILIFQIWSNDIWHTEFSWNKVVRGDSMASTDGAQLEKVWEPMF